MFYNSFHLCIISQQYQVLLRLLVRILVSLKSARDNNLCNLSISFKGTVKVSLHGTSMPPCDRYCLAPVTLQEMTPLLINAEQVAEIIRGTWATTTLPRITWPQHKDHWD